MKKLLLVLIVVLVAALAITPSVAVAEEADNGAQNSEISDFVAKLCSLNKSDKDGAREFIVEKFNEALSGVNGVEVGEQVFSYPGITEPFVNLIAKITKSGSDKQIIIGAHYDTVGEGAGDNTCGVAALYLTMKALASNVSALPCSVVFVAFDGEEDGLLGSEYYVSSMKSADVDNTLVMFNIDTIATGDNLYLHCENKATDLAKLILSNAEGLQEKPYAKGVFGNTFDFYGYGYYEMVQGSDHTPFRLSGIPIAFFFSGTYSSTVWGYAENSDPSKAVMNSSNDTFVSLARNHPEFEKRIEAVSNAVVKTVTSGSFLSVAQNARKQLVNLDFWYNVWWPIIGVAIIFVAAIVLAILHYRKLQKDAILGTTEIKSQTVFEKPSAEEIFSFKSDDVDDVFTFKK